MALWEDGFACLVSVSYKFSCGCNDIQFVCTSGPLAIRRTRILGKGRLLPQP